MTTFVVSNKVESQMSYVYSKYAGPVLVPYWIANLVQRGTLFKEDLLDLNKLAQLCSQEDLCQMLEMNTKTNELFGSQWPTALEAHWQTNSPVMFKTLQTLRALTDGKIFDRYQKTGQCLDNPGFDVWQMNTTSIGQPLVCAVIYPGFFAGDENGKNTAALTRAFLKAFYVFSSYSDVAKSSMFWQYSQLLAEQVKVL